MEGPPTAYLPSTQRASGVRVRGPARQLWGLAAEADHLPGPPIEVHSYERVELEVVYKC
jgi:FtsP/CotA-like multicopper oxidase with cupredoxin domain